MDRRLLTLSLGMFALGTDSFVFAGILPEIARSFDVSIGAAGQLISVYAISYALLGPTIAALAAKKLGPTFDAFDPDLRRFRSHGGQIGRASCRERV